MITLRLSNEQHAKVANLAAAVDQSMNAYCLNVLLGIPTERHGKIRGRKSRVLTNAPYGQSNSGVPLEANSTGTLRK
jgi:hypothetical protein